MSITTSKTLDVLGIGFGPANLALAAALEDEKAEGSRWRFLERRSSFAWHPGMLLENSRIQVTFLKDLATFRDPRSRFTFLSYLWHQGRLSEFSNLRDFYPSRREFNDYLTWVAEELAESVAYECEVTRVTPVPEGERIVALDVESVHLPSGRQEVHRTRNLVLAAGGVPATPPALRVRPGGRVFHTAGFLPSLAQHFPDRDAAYRFIVVGDGQSAAEAFRCLLDSYPNAEVTAALRRAAYRPMDESHFANEAFFPERVDEFYELPAPKREELLTILHDTNYAVADADLIADVYRRLYEERHFGRERSRILPFHDLQETDEEDGIVQATFLDRRLDRPTKLTADAVVLGTGYSAPNPHPLLRDLHDHFDLESSGRYRVGRHYDVLTQRDFEPGVFLQGYCTRTHGIGDPLLSLMAVRSAEICAELRQRLSMPQERLRSTAVPRRARTLSTHPE